VKAIFKTDKAVIGMLHLPPLPGSPDNTADLLAIKQTTLRDAHALVSGGVDGLVLENFGDTPFYPSRVPPHTVAFMTALGREVTAAFPIPLGINVLRNDARSALAVATAIGAAFIRVNVYTGARVTDQGIVEGEAYRVLRYRKLLGSPVKVFADVAVKHSAALADYDLADEVRDTALRGRADAIIVSGTATGQETRLEDLKLAKEAAENVPILVGSGVTPSNLNTLFAYADGLIVGTAFKEEGITTNPVDVSRVREFMKIARDARAAIKSAQIGSA
jgi:membrane complex biogenesis BtpA family protein